MLIVVRVASSQAMAKMAALQKQTVGFATAAKAASAVPLISAQQGQRLVKWGNQLQWAGRQLQYNFTLPIAIAGVAATKFAMDNEKAFTRVKKVYGDTAAAAKQFRKENENLTQHMAEQKATRIFNAELQALQETFVELSNHFGVAQKDVLDVASAWAAAGASGIQLAKSVKLTLEAVILGDMEAADATTALISVQKQFGLSTGELSTTLAYLNAVENQTSITMPELIQGFQRAGGIAREAGVDVRHLAAMLAALVPAAGSAAQAGNALKTIISRLMAPTSDTTALLNEMGIQTDSVAWQSATATERLEQLALKYDKLTSSQKNQVASVIGSRWQVNKLNILMKELLPNVSNYEVALGATSDRTQAFAIYQRELNAVLQSSPQRLQQTWVILQNALADAIIPAIPYILYLADSIADLVHSFTELNPEVQKFIMIGLVLLAVLGPIMRYLGTTALLVGELSKAWVWFTTKLWIGQKATTAVGVAATASAGGLKTLLAALTVRPILFFGSTIMTVFGAMSGWFNKGLLGIQALAARFFPQLFTFIAGWMSRVWLLMSLGGAKATIITGWRMLVGGIGAVWATLQAFILRTWAVTQAVLATSMLGGAGGRFIAAWGMFCIRIAAMWQALWAFIANPKIIVAALTRVALTTGAFVSRIGAALISPWGIAIAVILGILYHFRDQFVQIWDNIVNYFQGGAAEGLVAWFSKIVDAIIAAWNVLPEGVQNALIATVRVIQAAALEIYSWLQYLNPFATHSPSLVQNVEGGMAKIRGEFAKTTQIRQPLEQAGRSVRVFKGDIQDLIRWGDRLQQLQDRAVIQKIAPSALASYDALIAKIRTLNNELGRLQTRLDAQQRVVDRWQAKVDDATDAIERQQNKLDHLNDVLGTYQDKLSAAQERLDYFANAPLKGMDAMEDKIFRNEMAQKRLRLEMMRMEDAVGTLDEIKSKIDEINGAQELLSGEKAALRAAGAGSEILSQYDNELKKLDQQKDKYQESADKLEEMSLKLDALQRQAEKLDLVKSLKFDVLQHKIDEMVDTSKELTFAQIVAGIKKSRNQVEFYTKKVDKASQAVENQQHVVDKLTKHRDKLQNRLDRETEQLDRIQRKYDRINDRVSDLQTTLSDATSAASQLNAALSRSAVSSAKDPLDSRSIEKAAKDAAELPQSVQDFRKAAKGDFPDVGGKGIDFRKNWKSQVPQIEDFTQQIADSTSKMFEDINPFAPLRAKFNAFLDWLGTAVLGIGHFFQAAFKDVDFGIGKGTGKGIVQWLQTLMTTIGKILTSAWDLFGPEVRQTLNNIWKAVKEVWSKLGPELAKFSELLKPTIEALGHLWDVAKPLLGLIGIAVVGIIKVLWSVFNDAFLPVVNAIVGILSGQISIIRGVFRIIVGVINFVSNIIEGFFDLITGDWKGAIDNFGQAGENLKQILKGIGEVFSGVFEIAWSIIKGVFQTIWGVVKGFVTGIVDFFQWLWDQLVGHSIIPDMMHKIADWFWWLIDPIKKALGKIWDGIQWLWDKISGAWDKVWDKTRDIWDNVTGKLSDVKDYIKGKFWDAFHWFFGKISGVWDDIWDKTKDIWNNVIDKLDAVKDFVKGKFWDAFNWFWEKLKAGWDKVWNKTKDIWDNVHDKLDAAKDYIKGKFWDGFHWVIEHITGAWDTVWNKTKNIWDNVVGKLKAVKDFLVDKLKPAFSGFKDFLSTVWDKIKNIVQNSVGFLLRIIEKLTDAYDWVAEKVGLPKINYNVPSWASGGGGGGGGGAAPPGGHGGGHVISAATGRVMPGYTPGRDIYNVNVSGGESIMRPEWTRAMGRKEVDRQNRIARIEGVPGIRRHLGGFKMGGGVSPFSLKGMGYHTKGVDRLTPGMGWKYAQHYANKYLGGAAKGKNALLQQIISSQNIFGGGPGVLQRAYMRWMALRSLVSPYGPRTTGSSYWGNIGGFAAGGFVDPMKRVTLDGEPLTAIHRAQIMYAMELLGKRMYVIQGSWQRPTSYSGTSHTGPGVADTGPGTFRAQAKLRRVGVAAWARNIPGAAQAGSGAHVHGVSFFSAPGNSQLADYKRGGDGLGGRDYGPRPPMIRNLQEKLKRFGDLAVLANISSSDSGGFLSLPEWLKDPKGWLMDKIGLTELLNKLPDTAFGDVLRELPLNMLDAMASKIKSMASDFFLGDKVGGHVWDIIADTVKDKRPAWTDNPYWGDLVQLINHESNADPTAQNPDSTAYGIFQFLDSTWATVGGHKTSDPRLQTIYGLRYIAQKYGNPSNAWDYWQANGNYDRGGTLMPGWNRVYNATGKPENLVPVDMYGSGKSGRVININGNLSFPNITSGDDAEEFLRNLEALAGGYN